MIIKCDQCHIEFDSHDGGCCCASCKRVSCPDCEQVLYSPSMMDAGIPICNECQRRMKKAQARTLPALALLGVLLLIGAITPAGVRSVHSTPATAPASQPAVERLLDVLVEKESGGNDKAVGDNGRAKGPLQIWDVYWRDACRFSKSNWSYLPLVWDRTKSRQIVKWYWQLYCPQAYREGNLEVLSRVHNGGPFGYKLTVKEMKNPRLRKVGLLRLAKTQAYWEDVKTRLAKKSAR